MFRVLECPQPITTGLYGQSALKLGNHYFYHVHHVTIAIVTSLWYGKGTYIVGPHPFSLVQLYVNKEQQRGTST